MKFLIKLYKFLKKNLLSISKNLYNFLDPLNVILFKILHNHKKPIPPLKSRIRVGNREIKAFLKSGLNCYIPIYNQIKKKYNPNEISKLSVLDFGAGVGRTLQYFTNTFGVLYATDIDESASNFLKQNYTDIVVSTNQYHPPLNYPNNLFHVAYSVSVWTHICPEMQIDWLLEIKRILQEDGLALITTVGHYGVQSVKKLNNWLTITTKELEDEGFKYFGYPGNNQAGIKGSYGIAFHSKDYILTEWSKYFEILDIHEGVIDNMQDLVVMKKQK